MIRPIRSGPAAWARIACPTGMIIPPPKPCSTRKAISDSVLHASPHSTEPTRNSATRDHPQAPAAEALHRPAGQRDHRRQREQVAGRRPTGSTTATRRGRAPSVSIATLTIVVSRIDMIVPSTTTDASRHSARSIARQTTAPSEMLPRCPRFPPSTRSSSASRSTTGPACSAASRPPSVRPAGASASVDLIGIEGGHTLRDITVETAGEEHAQQIGDAVDAVDGARTVDITDRTFQMHVRRQDRDRASSTRSAPATTSAAPTRPASPASAPRSTRTATAPSSTRSSATRSPWSATAQRSSASATSAPRRRCR